MSTSRVNCAAAETESDIGSSYAEAASSAFVGSDNHIDFTYYRRALSTRRRSSVRLPRTLAHERPADSKSFELEQRLSRLEVSQRELLETLKGLTKRLIALQAQLDHVAARIGITT